MTTPDGRVYDHPPLRGRLDGLHGRCLQCGRLIASHAGWFRRWAWRQGWL